MFNIDYFVFSLFTIEFFVVVFLVGLHILNLWCLFNLFQVINPADLFQGCGNLKVLC